LPCVTIGGDGAVLRFNPAPGCHRVGVFFWVAHLGGLPAGAHLIVNPFRDFVLKPTDSAQSNEYASGERALGHPLIDA